MIMDYNQTKVIPSKGKSGAVIPIKNNLIVPESINWPPMELVSKFYKSEHLKDYEKKYHEELIRELGYYCDLASIKSEDAMTWSLFGYISKMDKDIQNNFYNEFLGELKYKKDNIISIELWKTLPHPETFTSTGPEIDVFILGENNYMLIECKWTSGIGKNQGKDKKLDQIQIREMFKNGIGKKILPNKECIIVLVANENINNNSIFISWKTLSTFSSLPHKEIFNNYLEWKNKYI